MHDAIRRTSGYLALLVGKRAPSKRGDLSGDGTRPIRKLHPGGRRIGRKATVSDAGRPPRNAETNSNYKALLHPGLVRCRGVGRCIFASHRWTLPPAPVCSLHVFYGFDNKSTSEPHAQGPGYFYGTIGLELAEDPQTILAYEMNGQPLPILHGAPLRLRVETQLGFAMVKYIRAIEFIEDYKTIGQGQGGWREDYQYFSQEAGI